MTKDKPIERCSECGEPTGKAGIGEDSLTVDGVNPLCEKCFDASMTGAEQSGEVDVKLKQVLALVADTIYTLRKDFFPDKTAGRMVGSLDKAVPIIKQLLQQKPRKRDVTREWLEDWIDRIWSGSTIDKNEVRTLVLGLLKELGMGAEE